MSRKHYFISYSQYIPSKPLCKKCGFAKTNRRHKIFGITHIFGGSKSTVNPQRRCENCLKKKKLTKHHLKDINGDKTGEIQRICRDCHDIAEYDYIKKGIVKPTPKGTPKHTLPIILPTIIT